MQALRTLRTPAFARTFSTTTPRALARMQLIGRLADQPELSPTSTGREITRCALGVSTGPRDADGNRPTSWFNMGSFVEGPQRELLLSLPKGTLIHVEADARMDTYDAKDGTQKYALNLLMRSFEALSRPQNRQVEGEAPAQAAGSA